MAWLEKEENHDKSFWKFFKTTEMFSDSFLGNHQLWRSPVCIGHLRHQGSCVGIPNYFNTHPFRYGPFIFCHNGKINDFSIHKNTLWKSIHPRLRSQIKGQTDSEYLFFLLLSFCQEEDNMLPAFLQLDEWMKQREIIYYGNFILGTPRKIWITRLTNCPSQSCCSLYMDNQQHIISSEPLRKDWKVFPVQKIGLFDLEKETFEFVF